MAFALRTILAVTVALTTLIAISASQTSPPVSHTADEIHEGEFQAGEYFFPVGGTVTMNSSLMVGVQSGWGLGVSSEDDLGIYGVSRSSDPNNAIGVYGQAVGSGVFGRTDDGKGVFGFASDTGTGVYGTSVNGLAGQFDGDVVIEDGNVGIGTANPQTKLEIFKGGVNTNGATDGFLLLQSSGDPAYRWSQRLDTSGHLYFDTNWGASDETRLTLHRSGNVGVGTSSPAVKFQVAGDSSLNDVIRYTDTVSGQSVDISVDTNLGGYSGTLARVTAVDGQPLALRAGAQDRVFIDASTGNVGVGTTSPSQKLHVHDGRIAVSDGYNIGDADADTGMFVDSNQVKFQTAGTTVATIDASGNVVVDSLKAPTGSTYFVCVDDAGKLKSQVAACA